MVELRAFMLISRAVLLSSSIGLLLVSLPMLPSSAAQSPLGPSCLQLAHQLQRSLLSIEQRYGFDCVKRSVQAVGGAAREALLLSKLLTGERVKVAMVGGSITAAGHLKGGVQHGNGTYGAAVVDWLNEILPPTPPSAPHSLTRAFMPGAGSSILSFCSLHLFECLWPNHSEATATDADIILLDVAANDWSMWQPGMQRPQEQRKYMHVESLTRQLLSLPRHPLLLFINFGVFQAFDPPSSSFLSSSEGIVNVVASYYSSPAISMFRAFFPFATRLVEPRSSSNEPSNAAGPELEDMSFVHMFFDHSHPTPSGHLFAGSLLVHYLASQFLELIRRQGQQLSHHSMLPLHPNLHHLTSCSSPLCAECAGEGGFLSALSDPSDAAVFESKEKESMSFLALGPKPLQSEEHPNPLCSLSAELTVLRVGSKRFDGGMVPESGLFGDDKSAWVLQECGPLVPALRCWKARKAGEVLELLVKIPSQTTDRSKNLHIVYKMRSEDVDEYRDAGADVVVENSKSFLNVQIAGNKLTHFLLSDVLAIINVGQGQVQLSITPRTNYFEFLAIVAD